MAWNAIAKTSFQAAVVDMVADNCRRGRRRVRHRATANEVQPRAERVVEPRPHCVPDGQHLRHRGRRPGVGRHCRHRLRQLLPGAQRALLLAEQPADGEPTHGLQWLPRLLYPDAFDDSIEDATRAYYSTMYNYDLSDTELADLIKDAVPKA